VDLRNTFCVVILAKTLHHIIVINLSPAPDAPARARPPPLASMLDSFYDDDSDDGCAAFATVRSNASARENVCCHRYQRVSRWEQLK
jgi:hypothetical protein